MAQIPPQLQHLLGSSVQALDAVRLARLIGWEEGQFLEFKEQIEDTKSGREEFAVDVTALANGGGGLLVVGMSEDRESGTALALPGIESSGDFALHVEQILGSKVQPPLPLAVGRVQLEGGRIAIGIAVEAGPLRPHAVLSGTSKLSYPVRRGRAKGYLTEAEVADSYARRFESAGRRAAELEELHSELTGSLPMEHQVWLAVTLIPSTPGFATLRTDTQRATEEWLRSLPFLEAAQREALRVARVGYRGVEVSNSSDYPSLTGRLKTDGAGALASGSLCYWRSADGTPIHRPDGGATMHYGDSVSAFVETVVDMLLALGGHARRSGATGTASVGIQLVTAPGCVVTLAPAGRRVDDMHLYGRLRDVVGSGRLSRRSVNLSAVPDSKAAVLDAARLLLIDFASEHGHADLLVFDDHGRLVQDVAAKLHPRLQSWAIEEDSDIEIVTA